MADFDLFKVKVNDRYFLFSEKGRTCIKRRRLTYCASKSVQPFWLHPHQSAQKVKKGRTLICWVRVPPSGKFFRNQILLDDDDVINRAKYFFNRFTQVSLARGQTSQFSV